MVARGVGRWSCFSNMEARWTGTRATIKALPTPRPPLSPLRMLMSPSSVDAYWAPTRGVRRGRLPPGTIQRNLSNIIAKENPPHEPTNSALWLVEIADNGGNDHCGEECGRSHWVRADCA